MAFVIGIERANDDRVPGEDEILDTFEEVNAKTPVWKCKWAWPELRAAARRNTCERAAWCYKDGGRSGETKRCRARVVRYGIFAPKLRPNGEIKGKRQI